MTGAKPMRLYALKYPARRLLLPVSRTLGRVHPDAISYLATAITIPAAFCYVYAADSPALLLWAIGLTLLRMTLNTLDGMIAIRRGNLSLKGEIVNALPDCCPERLASGETANGTSLSQSR